MTDTPEQDAAHPAPGKGFRAALRRHILHPEMTSEQLALSFGVGFSLAWNPFLGLHTGIVLLACFLSRRLHRPIMLLACYINNPWTMVPMASLSALVGNILLGRGLHLDMSGVHWHAITWRSFICREGFDAMLHMLTPILLPYILGGLVMSALAFPVGYVLMLRTSRRLRKVHLHMPHLHHPPQRPPQ